MKKRIGLLMAVLSLAAFADAPRDWSIGVRIAGPRAFCALDGESLSILREDPRYILTAGAQFDPIVEGVPDRAELGFRAWAPSGDGSGLYADMCFFKYTASRYAAAQSPIPPATGTLDGTKKVIAYAVLPGAAAYDTSGASFHGTHVAGSVLGDNLAALSTPSAHSHDDNRIVHLYRPDSG